MRPLSGGPDDDHNFLFYLHFHVFLPVLRAPAGLLFLLLCFRHYGMPLRPEIRYGMQSCNPVVWKFPSMKPQVMLMTVIAGLAWIIPAPAAAARLTYIEQFECTREPWGMPIPATLAALRKLGTLKRETVQPGDVPGNRVFEYDGLAVWTVDARAQPGQVVVERIEVTSPRWQWSSWANVGDTLDAALERLRWPAAAKGPKLEFGGDADAVSLYVDGGRIVRIVYTCYAGHGA
jgi:hypothetical protein